MFLDKTETFVLNISGLNKRHIRKNLLKLLKQVHFCKSFKFTIFKKSFICFRSEFTQATTTIFD